VRLWGTEAPKDRHNIYTVYNGWTCNEDWGVVWCNTVSLSVQLTSFRMVIIPSRTGSNIPRRTQPFFDFLILETKALLSFEPSDATLLTTLSYIPEYLSLEQHRCENFKSRTSVSLLWIVTPHTDTCEYFLQLAILYGWLIHYSS